MALSRHFGLVAVVGACFALAAGCGEDDGKKVAKGEEEAGAAGEAPTAGKTNNGGSKSNDAGSPAITGGAGGEGAAVAVQGGAAGAETEAAVGGAGGATTTSDGGAAPVAGLKQCIYECEIDADCSPIEGGKTRSVCNLERHRCEDPYTTCEIDADCLAFASTWLYCAGDGNCETYEACVDFEGQGFCALRNLDGCGNLTSLSMPRFGIEGNVTVCVDDYGVCLDGVCDVDCHDPLIEGLACIGKGLCRDGVECECQSDDECKSNKCGDDGKCVECLTSDDCFGQNINACVDGKCGCDSVDVCGPNRTKAATFVCE